MARSPYICESIYHKRHWQGPLWRAADKRVFHCCYLSWHILSETEKGDDSFPEINPDLRPPVHSSVLRTHLIKAYLLPTLQGWPFTFFLRYREFYKFPVNTICLLGVLGETNTTEERGCYAMFVNSVLTLSWLITISEYMLNVIHYINVITEPRRMFSCVGLFGFL